MGRMVKKLLTVPDSRLITPCKEVLEINNEIRQLANDLAMTMFAHHGLGLAANQIGANVRLIVIGIIENPWPLWIINPTISITGGVVLGKECCLSLPGLEANIPRNSQCIVEGMRLNGEKIKLEANGLTCRVIQHELDHLDGKTILDRLPPGRRNLYLEKLRKERRKEIRLHVVHEHELYAAGGINE